MNIYLNHNITGKITDGKNFIVHPITRKMLRINEVAKDFIDFISSSEGKTVDINQITTYLQNKYNMTHAESSEVIFKLVNYFYNEKLVNTSQEYLPSTKKLSLSDKRSILSAYLTLTRRCNLFCKVCNKDQIKESEEVNTQTWKHFINQIYEWGVLDLYFLGGEPLLRKDCVDLLKEAENCGIPSTLFTNGLLINNDICNKLSQIDSLTVQLYLHGSTPSTCDSSFGVKGAYDKIINTIRLLVQNNIRIGVITTFKEDTINQMEDFLRLLVNLGVSEWFPSLIVPIGCAAIQDLDESPISDAKFKTFINDYFDLISFYKDAISIKGSFNIHVLQNKNAVWGLKTAIPYKHYNPINIYKNWINIDANGDLTPSGRLKKYKLGNIKEKLVSEMLSDKILIENQKTALAKDLEKFDIQQRCDNCRYLGICGGAMPEISSVYHNLIDKWCDPVKCRFFYFGFESILRHSTPPSYNIFLELTNRSPIINETES